MGKLYFVGVDIGGTNVDALLVTKDLEAVAFSTSPIRGKNGASPVTVITQTIEDLFAQVDRFDLSQVIAIGVGVPGLVDASAGRVDLAVNLDEKSMLLGPILQAHFGRPVFVENDANAVALGAAKFLIAESIKNLAFITIGTGVGAGLVLDGKIFHGARNMAGEIGHMFVKESDIRCQCGAYGCLETFVAGPAIARIAQAACTNSEGVDSVLKNVPQLEAANVFIAADQGDALALEIVEGVGLILARAIQGMIMSFDLEKIIIGGGISRAGQTLLNPILKEWARMRSDSVMASEMLLPEKLELCPADYKAGAWGAVAVGMARSNESENKIESLGNMLEKEPLILNH
ncbi:MAG: ROK family protein [Anaerolineae bacterium]